MKKAALFLIFIIIMGILPIQAQTELSTELTEPYTSNLVTYYPDSQGYDVVKRPDGSTWIYSQRYHVEAYDKGWKQVGTPYKLTVEDETVTRYYTDYLGTEIQVITDTDTQKTDIRIESGKTREYRIVWTLDGVTNTEYEITETMVNFTSGSDWVAADWSDAQVQGIPTVSDSANGKKLLVVFNVGNIADGETYTLDPVLIDSYTTANWNSYNDLEDNHPSATALSAGGQSFTGVKGNITSVQFYLRKNGLPTGNAYAYLYSHSGVYGVSSVPNALLATSEPFDVSTLTGAVTLIEFTFNASNTYSMTQDNYYCIFFATPATGTIDAGNEIWIGLDNTPAHDGNYFYYENGWNVDAARDTIFYVYANVSLEITDLDTDSIFSKDSPGWLNVTVFDPLGVADINTVTVYINTTGDVNNFTLRWTQATNTFSEVSDPDGICSLDAVLSERNNINATKDLISFNFNITGGQSGLCDIRIIVTSDTVGAVSADELFLNAFEFSYFNWVDEVYDYINSAFEQFGIINYMAQITTYITGLTTWFTSSLTRILALLVQQFTIIEAVYGFFIYWTTELFAVVLDFSTFYHELLDGTSGWSDALVPWWNFATALFPIVPVMSFILWLDSIDSRGRQTVGGGIQVFLNDINTAIGLISYFFGIFSYVANTIIDRIYGLFDAVP